MKRLQVPEKVQKTVSAFQKKKTVEKTELALAETVAFLRNCVSGDAIPSSEVILTELIAYQPILAPGFAGMLTELRQNNAAGALERFTSVAGEKEGKDIGRLLLEWDRLDAPELIETLLSFQRHLSEVRYTRRAKEDEIISDLLYIPVVLNVMLVFVNFIVVGFFIEQKELFEFMF